MSLISGGWDWPVAELDILHDGDTAKLRISCGFSIWAYQWIRLLDVYAPELNEAGGEQAKADAAEWFSTFAPDGIVRVTTYRTSAPLEIRFRATFTRFVGTVRALDDAAPTLNAWQLERGYTDQGVT